MKNEHELIDPRTEYDYLGCSKRATANDCVKCKYNNGKCYCRHIYIDSDIPF